MLSWPLPYDGLSNNSWGGDRPPPQGFTPQGGSCSSEAQVSQALYIPTSIPASETTANGRTCSDFIYPSWGSEPGTLSYLSGLTTYSPFLSHDVDAAFAITPYSLPPLLHGATTTAAADTISTGLIPPSLMRNPDSQPTTATNPESLPPPAQPTQSATHHIFDEQLASQRRAISKTRDRATTTASTASVASSDPNGSDGNSNRSSSSGSDDGLSALHIASHRGHVAIVRTLLEHEVNIDELDNNGRTALQMAAINGHEAVVQLLLQRGAYINACDALGRTALHWAALQKHEAVLRVFLDAGADGNICDTNGWSVLHVAIERGFEAGLKLLLLHGADLSLKARKCESWKQLEPPA